MRTLEEIAKDAWIRIWNGKWTSEELVLDALREAVAQRDMEWWEAVGGVDTIAPEPVACKRWQMSLQALAVAQERTALREKLRRCMKPCSPLQEGATTAAELKGRLLVWLDTREKSE